jgi:hypothetical protein
VIFLICTLYNIMDALNPLENSILDKVHIDQLVFYFSDLFNLSL